MKWIVVIFASHGTVVTGNYRDLLTVFMKRNKTSAANK
jgi:hypothetical protein